MVVCCKCGKEPFDNDQCQGCGHWFKQCNGLCKEMPAFTESFAATTIEARAPIGTPGYKSQTLSQQLQGPQLLPPPPLSSLHPSASSSNPPASFQPVEPEDCPTCGEKKSGSEHECSCCEKCGRVLRKGKRHMCARPSDRNQQRQPRPRRTKTISGDMSQAEVNEIWDQRDENRTKSHRDWYKRANVEKHAKMEAERGAREEKRKRTEAEKAKRRSELKAKSDRDFQERQKNFVEGSAAYTQVAGRTMSQGPSQAQVSTIPSGQSYLTYGQGYTAQVPTPIAQPMGAPLLPIPHPAGAQPAPGTSSGGFFDPVRDAKESEDTGSGTAGTTEQDPNAGSSQAPKATEKRKSDKKPGESTKKSKK